MKLIRKILYPFSLLYGLITFCRNKAFDAGLLSSRTFEIPIIAVGNLNVGGTGKSPMVEYLIRLFGESFQTAVVSRGYGRKTKGFILAGPDCSAKEVGDEPFQFYRKFKNIVVAVDEKRARGIETLLTLKAELNLMLLDDAFQHRYVKADTYILLTAYDSLYVDDCLLPTGNLRESKSGAHRAQLIMVSKCPKDISENRRSEIVKKIAPLDHQNVFFSSIAYDQFIYSKNQKIPLDDLKGWKVLLVTGIANPNPLMKFLDEKKIAFEHIKFADHEIIGNQGKDKIVNHFTAISDQKKLILTTEKDFVRNFLEFEISVHYLPIKMIILDEEEKFNEIIDSYVRKN